MPNLSWTPEQIQLLKDNYPFLKLEAVALLVSKTAGATKTKATKLGLKKTVKHYNESWSDEEEKFLQEYYSQMTAKQLADRLVKTKSAVKNRLHKLQLYLPAELRKKRKLSTSFKPGDVPVNKGKKWDDFMSKEAQEKSRKTTFKTGNLPHNTKFDNAISVRKDNRGVPYKFIRISKGQWLHLHVFNYIEKHGSVPAGYNVYFLNGDTMNCEPDNLGIETNAENMIRNNEVSCVGLSDNYVAGLITHHNPELRKKIKEYPELIDIKKQQLKLNRKLNNYEQRKN